MTSGKVDEAASTNFFFIIENLFHIANQLYKHSRISRTIASSQHHPRETRPLLSQSNLYKKRFIGFAYDEFVSYIGEKCINRFANSFFSHSPISLVLPATPY